VNTNSKIEWTESTWNPVTGCTKVSEGCQNCYAERLAKRLQAMGNRKYKDGFKVTLHPDVLEEPLKRKKQSIIFVNSMSDLFHDGVPVEYIKRVFAVMQSAEQHIFQILTKREARLKQLAPYLIWPSNVWMGVTVETAKHRDRIDILRNVPSAIRFVSFEPLLSSLGKLDLAEIDWAIVGGESGPGARQMKTEWALEIKEQCEEHNTLFYFKQWGGLNKKRSGRELLGKTWDAMPSTTNSQTDQFYLALD
jgi:protein gp37